MSEEWGHFGKWKEVLLETWLCVLFGYIDVAGIIQLEIATLPLDSFLVFGFILFSLIRV